MRNFCGLAASSVRYHPPMLTDVAFGLNSSIASEAEASVRVRASLMSTGAIVLAGSSPPGEPPTLELARQFRALFGSGLEFGFTGTKEKPNPSAVTGQGARSLYSME